MLRTLGMYTDWLSVSCLAGPAAVLHRTVALTDHYATAGVSNGHLSASRSSSHHACGCAGAAPIIMHGEEQVQHPATVHRGGHVQAIVVCGLRLDSENCAGSTLWTGVSGHP